MAAEGPDQRELGLCPPQLRERYSVSARLGAGGMGAVFRGIHPGTGKPVALKVILGSQSKGAAARLVREARLLSRVRHPNLVEVYDCGLEEESPWVAMELVEGEDLAARAKRKGGHLTESEVCQIALEVGSVLTALERAGIVHRDIKPQNIMRDESGRSVVMDLGLALSKDDTRYTATGSLVGTLPYMAPEMFLDQRDGAALDWYALGVTLLILRTGRYPFTKPQVLGMAAMGEWTTPPDMPEDFRATSLGRCCLWLLAPNPKRRLHTEHQLKGVLKGSDIPSGALHRGMLSSTSLPARPRVWWGLLIPVCLAGLVVGGFLREIGDGPPQALPGPRAGGGDPQETASVAFEENRLREELGLPPEGNLVMMLEAILHRKDGPRREQLLDFMSTPRKGANWTFLRFRRSEATADHKDFQQLFRELDYTRAPRDYLEARTQAEVLAIRLIPEGEERAFQPDRLIDGQTAGDRIRRLDGFLAASSDLELRAARVELWGILARRLCARPRINLPAMEVCEELGTQLLPSLGELSDHPRMSFMLEFSRCLLRLGERPRWELFLEREQRTALAPLADPDLIKYWEEEQKWEADAVAGLGGIFLTGGGFSPDLQRLDLFRSSSTSARFQPDPSPGSFLEVRIPPGAPEPITLLAEQIDVALLERRRARFSETWLEQIFLPGVVSGDEAYREQVLRFPGLLLAMKDSMERNEYHTLFLSLLRQAEERHLSSSGLSLSRRQWYSGIWARLIWEIFEFECRVGDEERGLRRVMTHLGNLAKLSPPWKIGELENASSLVRRLKFRLDRNNKCGEYRKEALRLYLMVLEAIFEDPSLAPEGDLLRRLQSWLWDWGTSVEVRLARTRRLSALLVSQLSDEESGEKVEAEGLQLRIEAERVRLTLATAGGSCDENTLEKFTLFPEDPSRAAQAKDLGDRIEVLIEGYGDWRRRWKKLQNRS